MPKRKLNFIYSFIGMLATTFFLNACQNGDVSLQQLNIRVDGLEFDKSYANFTTPTLQKFSVQGLCAREITQVFFRFSSSETWTPITDSNGGVECDSLGSFKLNFDYPLSAIKESPNYSTSTSNNSAQLKLEFYGKTKSYRSKEISLIVNQFLETGKGQIAVSPETIMTNSTFKIRGRLTQYSHPTSELSSQSFKVKQGSLKLTQ